MFDNLIDLNNTVTCYFMYLIGQSSQGGSELALGIFFYRTDPLDEDKKDPWQEDRIWCSKKPLLIDSQKMWSQFTSKRDGYGTKCITHPSLLFY